MNEMIRVTHTFQIMYREPKATDWRCETRNKLHAYVRCVEPNVWVCRSLTQIPLNAVQCLLYRIFHKTSRFHINHHQHSRINAALCEFIFPFIMCIIIFIFVNITSTQWRVHHRATCTKIAINQQHTFIWVFSHWCGFCFQFRLYIRNIDVNAIECSNNSAMISNLHDAKQMFVLTTS